MAYLYCPTHGKDRATDSKIYENELTLILSSDLMLHDCRCDSCNAPLDVGKTAYFWIDVNPEQLAAHHAVIAQFFDLTRPNTEIHVFSGLSASEMAIREIQTPGFSCTISRIDSLLRKGSIVSCSSGEHGVEKFYLEFEDELRAVLFEESVKVSSAEIIIDEDTSLNAAPDDLRKEYENALLAEDTERIEEILTELWEEYGIHGDDNASVRKTSGVKRLAIMHDDGVAAFGFKGLESKLRKWMKANGFPAQCPEPNLFD